MSDSREPTCAEEDEFIRRSVAGDADAFGKLVDLHERPLRSFCSRYGPDPETADDIAQEVFLRAYGSLHRFEIGTQFGKWLRGIARNLLQDMLRKEAREARVKSSLLRARVIEQRVERLASGTERDDTVARAEILKRCLAELGGPARQLLHQRYARDVSAADLARRLDRRLSAVRMELLRIRRSLRRCVDTRIAGAGG